MDDPQGAVNVSGGIHSNIDSNIPTSGSSTIQHLLACCSLSDLQLCLRPVLVCRRLVARVFAAGRAVHVMCPLHFSLPPLHSPLALQVYQTVVHRLGPNNPAYTDAVVALADLHKELGQQQEAERCGRHCV